MKIEKLRFKNLNSLYGEWEIDFTCSEYMDSGIFALTGPTGAGKSTILDAICLALYGQTPRLKTISKSQNELMSRHSGECISEIVFTSQEGRFLCRFEQRKAKKQAQNNLQAPEHAISSYPDGKILATSRGGVLKLIEEKTGMNFQQFTRSTLLAQGHFDAFLKADISEKSGILEQITGTEIYSEISVLCHEKLRIEQDKLSKLQEQTNFISLLDDEQKNELQNLILNQENEEKIITEQKNICQAKINKFNNINRLQSELLEIKSQKEKLASEINNFLPYQIKLQNAKKASKADGVFVLLNTYRKQYRENNKNIEKQKLLIPSLEKKFADCQKSRENLINALNMAKQEFEKQSPIFKQVRFLDQKLTIQKNNLDSQLKIQEQENIKHQNLQAKITKDKKDLNLIQVQMEKNNLLLEQYGHDEILVSNLGQILEQLKSLKNIINDKNILLEKSKQNQAQYQLLLKDKHKKNLEKDKLSKQSEQISAFISKENEELEKILNRKLLREYRTQKDTLLKEKSLITIILSFEEHRKKLEDGKACPLCGALDHPFALGNIPKLSNLDHEIIAIENIILQAEKAEQNIIKHQEEFQKFKEKELNLLLLEQNIEKDINNLEKQLKENQTNLENNKNAHIVKENEIKSVLYTLNIAQMDINNLEQLELSLKDRLKSWQKMHTAKINLQENSQKLMGQINLTENTIQNLLENKDKLAEQIKILNDEYIKDEKERKILFAHKNIEQEEKKLHDQIRQIEKSMENNFKMYEESQKVLGQSQTQLTSIQEQNIICGQNIFKFNEEFISKILELGFENENKYLEAILTVEELEKLEKKNKELEQKKQELDIICQTKEQQLITEKDSIEKDSISKNLNPFDIIDSLENLNILLVQLQEQQKIIYEKIISAKQKLKLNKEEEIKFQEIFKKINVQKYEVERFEKLHQLIGSADGKKYRNFAQGLTFEVLINNANKQLAKMTDRYSLYHNKQYPLILNVIDNYQAGEIRPTINLSGGESFVVSLALALGLSQISGQKVKVQSLFLDEGFGTLDDDALETALTTLANIQEEGKLIGIISHVSSLKERITTQIAIKPIANGKSIIEGQGVRQIL